MKLNSQVYNSFEGVCNSFNTNCSIHVRVRLLNDFFLSEAKNVALAALRRGFLTYEKEKSKARYASLYRVIGIINPHRPNTL